MKKINKTLVAGIVAFSTLNAKAEISPFSFGLQVGGSLAKLSVDEDKVKIGEEKIAEGSMFKNFFVTSGIYGGYAFSDYLGVELGCNYMKQGGIFSVSKETNKSESNNTGNEEDQSTSNSRSMMIHGIDVPVSLCIYPIGREEGEGFVKLSLGGDFFIPVKHTILEGENEKEEDIKDQVSGFDFGLKFGAGYEFPIGVFGELTYGFGLLNKLKVNNSKGDDGTANDSKIFKDVTGLESAKDRHFTFNIGYNFGALLD